MSWVKDYVRLQYISACHEEKNNGRKSIICFHILHVVLTGIHFDFQLQTAALTHTSGPESKSRSAIKTGPVFFPHRSVVFDRRKPIRNLPEKSAANANCIFCMKYDLKQTFPTARLARSHLRKLRQSPWLALLKSASLISVSFWLVCQLLSGDPICLGFSLPWKGRVSQVDWQDSGPVWVKAMKWFPALSLSAMQPCHRAKTMQARLSGCVPFAINDSYSYPIHTM